MALLIVEMSGSGKTTLLKLLLRFYQPETGKIKVGKVHLSSLSFKTWRNSCGTVMQDGFIFADTIANNIAVGGQLADIDKIYEAIETANLTDFVNELPWPLHQDRGRWSWSKPGPKATAINSARSL